MRPPPFHGLNAYLAALGKREMGGLLITALVPVVVLGDEAIECVSAWCFFGWC